MHLNKTYTAIGLQLWQCPILDCTFQGEIQSPHLQRADNGGGGGEDEGKAAAEEDDEGGGEKPVDKGRVFDCPSCRKRVCLACSVEEHSGFTCAAFQAWKKENDGGANAFKAMFDKGLLKPCPNPKCRAPIMKNEGCNFMTCGACNDPKRMCWVTGKARYGPAGCGGGHNCH